MNSPFFQQLWALARKDLTIRRRRWFVTLLELSLPILNAWLAMLIGSQSEPSRPRHTDLSSYSPFPSSIQTSYTGTTYYTPDSTVIQQIIEDLKKGSYDKIAYCSSEEEMMGKIEPNKFCAQGLVFDTINPGSKFTIRPEPNPSGPPMSLKNEYRDYLTFWWSTFVGIHWQITVPQLTGASSKQYTKKSPFVDTFYYENSPYKPITQNIMLKAIVVGITSGNLIIITIAAKRAADEKIKGSKELLRMMGVADHTYWIAQFINYIPIFLTQAIVISCITLQYYPSDGMFFAGLLFTLLTIFLSGLLIAFTLTTIINKPILVQIAINVLIITGLSRVLQSDSKAIPSIDKMIFFPSSLLYFWLNGREDISGSEPSALIYLAFIPTWLILDFC